MNNLSKVIGLGGRKLNKALAMHYLFGDKGIPKDYVQDSLILWLDGIKNTRDGHNAEATVWEDLVGDVNFTKTANFSFGDNCILPTGKMDSDNTIVVPNEFTMEVVYQFTGGNNYHTIGFSEVYPRFKGRKSGMLPRWMIASGTWADGLEYTYALDLDATHSVAVSQNSDGRKCYHNGVFNSGDSVVATYNSAQTLQNYDRSEILTGKIFAIRLYNRSLTDEELAQNYEIDKQRFGIAETATASVSE